MNPGSSETALMTSEHALEDWHSTLLRLRVRAAETDQPSRTVFSCRQGAKMSTHVPEVAARRERSPLLRGWVLEAIRAIVGVVKAADSLAVLLNKLAWIQLGVDHDGIDRSMSEEGLDYVDWSVVVQMFGCKDAPAIMWQQDERRTIGLACASSNGDRPDARANRLQSLVDWDDGSPE